MQRCELLMDFTYILVIADCNKRVFLADIYSKEYSLSHIKSLKESNRGKTLKITLAEYNNYQCLNSIV